MNLSTALIALVVIVLILARRLAGQPLEARRLAVLPLVLVVVGGFSLAQVTTGPAVTDTGAVLTVTDHLVARWRQIRSVVILALLTFAMVQQETGPWFTARAWPSSPGSWSPRRGGR